MTDTRVLCRVLANIKERICHSFLNQVQFHFFKELLNYYRCFVDLVTVSEALHNCVMYLKENNKPIVYVSD